MKMILMTALLAVLGFSLGCSLFSPGPNEAVVKAQADTDAAKKELADVRARYERGEATRAELDAAIDKADKSLVALETALKISGAKEGGDLAGAGGVIGGTVAGPVGGAIGTVLGTIFGSIRSWMRNKKLESVLAAIQAGREELHATSPEIAKKIDKTVDKAMSAPARILIKKMKASGAIGKMAA